jgi:hypothetical protein
MEELSLRGELVKSAARTLEGPTVRARRQAFAAVTEESDLDSTVSSEMYGRSAESRETQESDDGFAAALARARSRSIPTEAKFKAPQWRPAILQFILDEVIVPRRSEHLDEPRGGYFRWEIKQAEEMNARLAEARPNGLGDDSEVMEWIRLK